MSARRKEVSLEGFSFVNGRPKMEKNIRGVLGLQEISKPLKREYVMRIVVYISGQRDRKLFCQLSFDFIV